MTLETIARLENALGIDLVKSALTYVSGYGSSVPSRLQTCPEFQKAMAKAQLEFLLLTKK